MSFLKKKPRSDSGSNRRVLATIFTIVFIDLLGFSILIPVIPLYATYFGLSFAR